MPRVSAQKAIHNHCKGCIYDPSEPGTWREQVCRCTITQCELYEHRPRSTAYKREQQLIRLAAMTPEERSIYEQKCRELRNRIVS